MTTMKDLQRRMAAGSAVAVVANVIYLATRLIITPFILVHVSLAEYGLWSFCFVILSYAGMSAFGINNAYIKYTAEYHVAGEVDKISRLLSTGLFIMGSVSLVCFGLLYLCAPWLVHLFRIDAELVDLSVVLLIGTASVFLIDLTLGAFRGVLEGLQEVVCSKTIWLITTLLEVLLIFAFLHMGSGIYGVLYAYVLKTLVDVLLNMVMAFRRLSGLRVHPALVSKASLNELFVFGGKVQILGFLGMFLGSLDRIITTGMLGLDATGLFEVGRKLPFTARSITGAASTPFLPAASAVGGWWQASPSMTVQAKVWKYLSLCIVTMLLGCAGLLPWGWEYWTGTGRQLFSLPTGVFAVWCLLALVAGIPALRTQWKLLYSGEYLEADELRGLYLRGMRYLNLINFVLYSFIIAAAPQILFAWVGSGYDEANGICFSVAVMCLIHLSTLPCSAMMRGINRSGRELEAVLINLVLMLLWGPAWTKAYGLMGTVWGVTLSTVVSTVHFIWRTNRAFRISFAEFWKQAVVVGTAPVLAGLAVYGVCRLLSAWLPDMNRWETLGVVLLLGMGYLVLCGILLRRFTLSEAEWNALTAPLLRRLGRGSSPVASKPIE
ncbi:oligosaccharide flippase family protein [Desulfovibrio subterraneus]|uniref:Polysaccharide biosynthesis protein C-terminal domain-containing protein n=1 Tax=Desulfovibrio subterraneus TaxID=2718620 RepID=A0A7J0BL94_9BACT|nr:oligosaccharide flippase family protein [Desulfovibrio subterraneus]GFM34477.1 hypothetical protein DSM101010T_28420 [Desulfovibrio subterraneus]